MSISHSDDGFFATGDVLLIVDVFNDFDHEDGERLLASFGERASNMAVLFEKARNFFPTPCAMPRSVD